MNRPEAVALCRLAKAMCPQQAIDEYTPDAWHMLLDDIGFEDAKAALAHVCKGKPFVSPAEIRAAVRRVRYERIEKFGYITPPPGLDFTAEQDYILAVRERVAAGELTREQYDDELRTAGLLGDRELPEIEGTFRRVPECDATRSRAGNHAELVRTELRRGRSA